MTETKFGGVAQGGAHLAKGVRPQFLWAWLKGSVRSFLEGELPVGILRLGVSNGNPVRTVDSIISDLLLNVGQHTGWKILLGVLIEGDILERRSLPKAGTTIVSIFEPVFTNNILICVHQ